MQPFNPSLIQTKERRKLNGRQRFIYGKDNFQTDPKLWNQFKSYLIVRIFVL